MADHDGDTERHDLIEKLGAFNKDQRGIDRTEIFILSSVPSIVLKEELPMAGIEGPPNPWRITEDYAKLFS